MSKTSAVSVLMRHDRYIRPWKIDSGKYTGTNVTLFSQI